MTETDNYEYNDYSIDERVSVFMHTRGKGTVGGWIDWCVHGTVLEVYPDKFKALVRLDNIWDRRYHIVGYGRLQSHSKRHKFEYR